MTDPRLPMYDLLGTTRVRLDGDPLEFKGVQPLRVLTVLAVRALEERSATAAELAELLGTSKGTIYNCADTLRKAFAEAGLPSTITKTSAGYGVRLKPGQVDLTHFRQLAGQAADALDRGKLKDALKYLDEALGLWRGSVPLASVDCADAALRRLAGNLTSERREARLTRCEINRRLGRLHRGRDELRNLAAEEPLSELIHRKLATAEYQCGDREQALQVCKDFWDRVDEELCTDPGPEFKDLMGRIRDRDPSLAPPAPEENAE